MPKITCQADYYVLCDDDQRMTLSSYAQRCQENPKMKMPARLVIKGMDYGNISQYYVTDHPIIQNIKKEVFPFWFIKKWEKGSMRDNKIRVTKNATFIIRIGDIHTTFGLPGLSPYVSLGTMVTIICNDGEYQHPINKLLINGQPIASYSHDQLMAIHQSRDYTISCAPDEAPKPQGLPKFYITGSTLFISNKGKYNLSDEILEILIDQSIVKFFAVSHSVFGQEVYARLAKYKLNIEIMFDA